MHLFSNAGFWTHAAAVEQLDASDRARIAAVVVDSAPGFPPHITPRFYASGATRAMMPMVLRSFGKKPAMRHPLLTPPLWAFFRLWYHVSPIQQRVAEGTLAIVREIGDWPQLYLYSGADTLVTPDLVEAFLDTLGGREVEHHRFEDSAHVLHMVRHRAQYFGHVAGLLGRAVQDA